MNLADLARRLQMEGAKITAVHGGSTNHAYIFQTKLRSLFVKTNAVAPTILACEYKNLMYVSQYSLQFMPQPHQYLEWNNVGILVLPLLRATNIEKGQWELGAAVSALHKVESENYGFPFDNYIGSLPQYNCAPNSLNWPEFYWFYRILPQLEIAVDRDIFTTNLLRKEDRFIHFIQSLHEPYNLRPQLIHGDLWSGNILCDHEGMWYIVDPASCYAIADMDIAMSMLFGGFHDDFYEGYAENSMVNVDEMRQRAPFYQLYYILVHANIFGGSYIQSSKEIFRQIGL